MININKKYQTRSGIPVRLVCYDKCGEEPVVIGMCPGRVYFSNPDRDQEIPCAWFVDTGQWVGAQGCQSNFDLVEVSSYHDWPIDTPVWARASESNVWYRRYFAGVDGCGRPMAWVKGFTSWVSDNKIGWHEMRLASEFTPEDEK